MRKYFLVLSFLSILVFSSCDKTVENTSEPQSVHESIQLNEHELALEPGDFHKLSTKNPSSNLQWSTSNPSVADFYKGSIIKGIGEGRATIMVKDLDTNETDCCSVAVKYSSIEPVNYLNVAAIAHRGYHIEEIENTRGAFVAAGRRNFYGIETDIHLTSDGKWICHHDNRVKNMSKVIAESTFEEIMAVNLSSNPENVVRVPTFEEYIEVCNLYNKHPIIEFKVVPNEQKLNEVLDILKKYNVLNEVMFISFMQDVLDSLYTIKQANNYTFSIFMLTSGNQWRNVPDYLNVFSECSGVNSTMMEYCTSNGRYVAAWNVNDRDSAENLINLGVKYAASDVFECSSQFVDNTLFGI